MTCTSCMAKVKSSLEQHSEVSSAEISLEQKTATLHMNTDVKIEELQQLFGKDSKYVISPVPKDEMEDKSESFLATYKPLLLIFFVHCYDHCHRFF